MAGNLPFGLAPSGELTAYQPTLRERVTDWLSQSLFTDDREGYDKAKRLTNWAETMIPPFGFATSMYDAGNQAGRGNYGTAAMMAGASFIPGPEGKAAEKAGIRAFHGSPHSFDRFDMSKIGTGEGAQAYGHGLYFAENEDVAQGYKRNVTTQQNSTGKVVDGIAVRLLRAGPQMSDSELANTMRQLYPKFSDDEISAAVSHARNMPSGHMYEVSINADPNSFLDWDKPLSEQTEAVRKALGLDKLPGPPTDEEVHAVFALAQERGVDAFEMPEYKALEARLDNYKSDAWKQMGIAPPYRGDVHVRADAITGGEYVHGLEKGELGPMGLATSTPNASRILKEKGIPGIKYLDAGSRGAGDGTRNYVVFDDKLISIVRKYGIAGASAYLGYDIMQNVTPAQADELKKIEGK